MGDYVSSTPACYRLNPDFSQKYKMGDISKGVANTLAKKYIKKFPVWGMPDKSLLLMNKRLFKAHYRELYSGRQK
jgi:hypothetical protein